jgi:hypothetical protein
MTAVTRAMDLTPATVDAIGRCAAMPVSVLSPFVAGLCDL